MSNEPKEPARALSSVDDNLPAVVFTKDHFLVSPTLDEEFLKDDLSVKRIEDIAPHLWMVGRPYLPRPLSLQRILKREIVATTDASLHLVWTYQTLYVKALPRYLVSKAFFEQRLSLPHPCGPALGLLFTYMALVPSELDFALAHDLHLPPTDYKWEEWKRLTRQISDRYPKGMIYAFVPGRYCYGELRLSRLGSMYHWNSLRGYSPLTNTKRYSDSFAENLTTIAAATLYMAVVLTAMQVGLGTDLLMENHSFQRACYGFAVFAIISPVIAFGTVVGVSVFVLPLMLVAEVWSTIFSHCERWRTTGVIPPQLPRSHPADDVHVA
jgi:hypothetical protein